MPPPERQARVLTEIVKAAPATTATVVAPVQPMRAEKELDTNKKDTWVQHQLMFGKLVTNADPNEPSVEIRTVVFPKISTVFEEILDTAKVSLAGRAMKEQFTNHVQQMATSQNFCKMTANFNVQSFDATLITAIKSANFAGRQARDLSLRPTEDRKLRLPRA